MGQVLGQDSPGMFDRFLILINLEELFWAHSHPGIFPLLAGNRLKPGLLKGQLRGQKRSVWWFRVRRRKYRS